MRAIIPFFFCSLLLLACESGQSDQAADNSENYIVEFHDAGIKISCEDFVIDKSAPKDDSCNKKATVKNGKVKITPKVEEWLSAVNGNNAPKGKITVTKKSQEGKAEKKWTISKGKPTKWSGPGLSAKGNETAMEELTLCIEDISIEILD